MPRRLLHDDEIDPRDRLAGSTAAALCPATHTDGSAENERNRVTTNRQVTITLARGPMLLPEPLAAVAARLRA